MQCVGVRGPELATGVPGPADDHLALGQLHLLGRHQHRHRLQHQPQVILQRIRGHLHLGRKGTCKRWLLLLYNTRKIALVCITFAAFYKYFTASSNIVDMSGGGNFQYTVLITWWSSNNEVLLSFDLNPIFAGFSDATLATSWKTLTTF